MNETLVEQFEHNGYRVSIHQDYDAESPDSWGDDDAVMIVTTRNRDFEKTVNVCGYSKVDASWFASDNDDPDFKREVKRDYHLVPLFAYIHSGVSLRAGSRGGYPFDCPWDSGQIGFVLVKKRQGFRNIQKTADSCVETWNQYLSGDVYGYVVETPDGEHIDSCWGMYGLEYVKGEAKSAVPDEPCPEHEDDLGVYAFGDCCA